MVEEHGLAVKHAIARRLHHPCVVVPDRALGEGNGDRRRDVRTDESWPNSSSGMLKDDPLDFHHDRKKGTLAWMMSPPDVSLSIIE
jgi:hypothetical protein